MVIELTQDRTVRVGRLGTFRFPKGAYVYTGSALAGIGARVRRHLRKRKKMRWHIDYLLRVARVVQVLRIEASRRVECDVNRLAFRVPGSRVVVPRFGSSDCSCPSHLAFWGPPSLRWSADVMCQAKSKYAAVATLRWPGDRGRPTVALRGR